MHAILNRISGARLTFRDAISTVRDQPSALMPNKSSNTSSSGPRGTSAGGSGGDAMLRIGATIGLPTVLRSLGANPSQLLTEVGLELSLFDSPDNLLSYSARGRLLEHCVARTGCEHLGLLVGQRGNLQSLGLVGSLVKYSPDVGTALRSLVRFFHLHTRGAKATLTVDGQLAYFGYQFEQPGTQGTDQVGDGALAVMLNIMKSLCGPGWRPSQVTLAHRKPANVEPFRQFFRAPLLFDAEQNTLVFLAEWLTYRLHGDDPELRRQLTEQIKALETRHRDSFPDQVRSVLRTALLTDRADADRIASLFSIHRRTLNRRLNEDGISFKDLVEEQRYEIARQTLLDTDLQVGDVAALLGYADASAFTRAFRRWSGVAPAEWRSDARRGRRSKN
jgi:AraC-like DNA-binding protein